MEPDFRENAILESRRLMEERGIVSALDAPFSVCLKTPDGPMLRRVAMAVELSTTVISLVLLIFTVGNFFLSGLFRRYLPGSLAGISPFTVSIFLLFLSIGLIAATEFYYASIFKMIFNRRRNGFGHIMGDFVKYNIEATRTREKMKLITEDNGFCRLDQVNQRLVFDGASYRYVIYARDVRMTEFRHSGSSQGIRICFQVGAAELDFVIYPTGQALLPFAAVLPRSVGKWLVTAVRGLDELKAFEKLVAYIRQSQVPPGFPPAPAYAPPVGR